MKMHDTTPYGANESFLCISNISLFNNGNIKTIIFWIKGYVDDFAILIEYCLE